MNHPMFAPPFFQAPPDQVIVTANRIETAEDQIASSASMVTEEDVERKEKGEIADLLRDVSGLSVMNSGGPGKSTSVFVRGADPNAVLVLIDGVEMNDALSTGDGYNFGNLSVQDIERIEVIRGSQSVLYGSGATAGVIQIFTKKGSGALKSTLEGEYGTYQSWRLQGNARGSTGPFHYYLGVGHVGTEGFPAADQALGNRLNQGQQMSTLTGNFGYELSQKTRFELSTRFSSAQFTFSNGGPPGYNTFGLRTGDDPGYAGSDEQGYAKLQLQSRVSDLWQPKVAFTYSLDRRTSVHDPNPLNEVSSQAQYESDRIRGLVQNDLEVGEAQTVSVGWDVAVEKGTSTELSSLWTGDLGIKNKSIYVVGGFAQDLVRWGSFFGTVGARFDVHQYAGHAFTYRLAPGYTVKSTKTTLRGSVGAGFKAPSLYQLFSNYGNLNLQPERSTSYDLGFDQEVGGRKNKLSLSVFRMNYGDLIQYDFQSQHYGNIDVAHTEGLEVSFQAEFGRLISMQWTYNYLVAQDDITNLPLLRRPTHQISSEWIYGRNEPIELGFSVRYVGDRTDLSAVTSERVFMPPYTVLGLTAHYRPNSALNVFGRIDNLLNLSYEEVNGYGTPLRSFYLGISYTI